MTQRGLRRLNTIALIGAAIAAIGLVMFVVADRMSESLISDYLSSAMTEEEYYDRVDRIGNIQTVAVILIALSTVVVAVSVPATTTSSFQEMKKKIEADFYRKCPQCGAWNTKFATGCSTCGIPLPRLQESAQIDVVPRVMKDGPPPIT